MPSFCPVDCGEELVPELLFICINENLFILINYFDECMEPFFYFLDCRGGQMEKKSNVGVYTYVCQGRRQEVKKTCP
jgi:hypothetical protein